MFRLFASKLGLRHTADSYRAMRTFVADKIGLHAAFQQVQGSGNVHAG